MLFSPDDDDNDFVPSGNSSQLASLFGAASQEGPRNNETLKYSAPKQPVRRKSEPDTKSTQVSLSLLQIAAIVAYKYENGSYTSVGKLGLALLGNHENRTYRVLLYRDKNEQLSISTVSLTFNFAAQGNNYASFYDDNNVNWSVKFNTTEEFEKFATQVVLAKSQYGQLQLTSETDLLICQDLVIGDGDPVKNKDIVSVRYSGSFITNYKLDQVFDTNMKDEQPLKVHIDGKIQKGWEDGLVGMRNNGHRLVIILPSSHYNVYGSDGTHVPPNTAVAFRVNVCGITRPSRKKSNGETKKKTAEDSPGSSVPSSDDGSIKAKTASISEQLSQTPALEKERVILRVAKVGQQLFPLHGGTSADSDSETDFGWISCEEKLANMGAPIVRPVPKPRPTVPISSHSQHPTICTVSSGPNLVLASPGSAYGSPSSSLPVIGTHPYGLQSMPMMTSTGMQQTSVSQGLTELRTQNVELRIAISKATDKIEQVLSKVDGFSNLNNRFSALSCASSSVLDPLVVAQTLQQVCEENQTMKSELREKNTRIESQTERITELLQQTHRLFEQSNSLLEQRKDQLFGSSAEAQLKLQQLELDKEQLKKETKNLKTQLEETSEKLEAVQAGEEKLKNECLVAKEQLVNIQKERQLLQKEVEDMKDKLKPAEKDGTASGKDTETKISRLEETVLLLTNRRISLENELTKSKEALESLKQEFEAETEDLKANHKSELGKIKEAIKTADASSQTSEDKRIQQLEAELNAAREWPKKFESFERDVAEMRKSYESRIQQLLTTSQLSIDTVTQVKRVMNAVFRRFKAEFLPNDMYSGSETLDRTLRIITSTTLELMQPLHQESSTGAQESSSEAPATTESSRDHPSDANTPVSLPECKLETQTVNSGTDEGGGIETSVVETEADSTATDVKFSEPTKGNRMEKPRFEDSGDTNDEQSWKPQPPPLVFSDSSDDDEDWMK